MPDDDIWDVETAQSYDTPGTGMFAPEVIDPAVDNLFALAEGGPVLEFAIGTGRLAVPLHQRGVSVAGIEMSEPMVAQLRTKADEATIPVVIGDMSTATMPGRYALVFLVFNTISNLLTQEQQIACFRNAARHLAPGGRFVIELWVPELRKLPPGQQAVVVRTEPATSSSIPMTRWRSRSPRTISASATTGRPTSSAPPIVTSGLPSST